MPRTSESSRHPALAACLGLLVAGCGQASTTTAPVTAAGAEVFCAPAPDGFLRARLQGAIDSEIDWSAPAVKQCLGGPRPNGDGLRLVYKGRVGDTPVLIVIGVAGVGPGESGRNVPANVTLVREGTGAFFSTQGDDKCALDELRQEPVDGQDGRFRLSGRGYCTQPARSLGNGEAGAVLFTRFDVAAVVEYSKD